MMGSSEQSEEEAKVSLVLSNIAERHGLKSPTTVALAYVMNKAPYVFPIIGGRKVEVSDRNSGSWNTMLITKALARKHQGYRAQADSGRN